MTVHRGAFEPTGLPPTALAARELLSSRFDVRRELARGRAYLSFESDCEGRRGTVLLLPIDCSGLATAREVDRRVRELSTFDHPLVAAILSHGIEEGIPWLEVEPIEGRTLGEHLAHGPMTRERALGLALDVLEALSAAHLRGHFHGELSPADIGLVVDRLGTERIRILGLGTAALSSELGERTHVQDVGERDRYVAPEVQRGRSPDAKADVYSVGALLYRMITDEVPPPAPIVGAFKGNPLLPADLEQLLLRSVATDPFERYASSEEMAAELRHALGAKRAASSRPARPKSKRLPSASTSPRPRHLVATVAVSALVAVLAFAVTYAWSTADRLPARQELAAADVAPPPPAASAPRAFPTPPEDPAPAPAAVPAEDVVDLGAPVVIEAPTATESGDPLDEELPETLASPYQRISGGERLTRGQLLPLYRYSAEHPEDPRPHLILGDAFVDLGWHTDAITRYRTAIELDPRSKQHSLALESLVLLTFEALVAEDAADTIAELYGAEAVPAVEAALASAENDAARARLEALRARLFLRGP